MTRLSDEMATQQPWGLLGDQEQMQLCVQHRGLLLVVPGQSCLCLWIVLVASLPVSPLIQLPLACVASTVAQAGDRVRARALSEYQ